MTAIPEHWIHIYDKPAQGNGFITRKRAYGYYHQKTALGGDDTMACGLVTKPNEGELALENWVGNRVAVFVDDAAVPVWEGLITRVYLDIGNLTVSRSLDAMFNRVTGICSGGVTVYQVPWHDEEDSQAIYGAKTGMIDGFITPGVTATAKMDAIRDLVINETAWPLTTVQQGGQGGGLRIECQGFYHTLKWDTVYASSSTTTTINLLISSLLAGMQNAGVFFDNTNTRYIETNAAYAMEADNRTGKTIWQSLQNIQGGGDGTNYWVVGISRTDYISGTRHLYYRPARSDVYYTARNHDGLRVRNLYGGLVAPWRIEPDHGIRIQDILTGWTGRGLDPRETYIETIRYDAEKQEVTWAGADDLHMQGAFRTQRYFKMFGTDFGAPVRGAWS